MSDDLVLVDEDTVRAALTPEHAIQVVRNAFVAAAEGTARNFPVVRERLSNAVFGVKSAVDEKTRLLGLKAGGAFPFNLRSGAPAHQSSVILFDFDTGRPRAIVAGNAITALRTAAAAALSIDLLARRDARTLGIVGAGAQAEAHLRAALSVRQFDSVHIWSRSAGRAEALAERVSDVTQARPQSRLPDFVSDCDVIITLTPATEPVLKNDWISAGTHLACMGADTVGKQEVEATLPARSRILTDDVSQALSIGECQTAFRAGLISRENVTGSLGDVLLGRLSGRTDTREITLFDGTGVALQDLFAATCVLEALPAGTARHPTGGSA